jgi:hypothetical protein
VNSFIVIIDNGAMWSDHRHTVVVACPDKDSADAACAMLTSWIKAKPVDTEDNDEINGSSVGWNDWLNRAPFPLPEDVREWSALEYRAASVTFAVLEVPAWAKDKP